MAARYFYLIEEPDPHGKRRLCRSPTSPFNCLRLVGCARRTSRWPTGSRWSCKSPMGDGRRLRRQTGLNRLYIASPPIRPSDPATGRLWAIRHAAAGAHLKIFGVWSARVAAGRREQ